MSEDAKVPSPAVTGEGNLTESTKSESEATPTVEYATTQPGVTDKDPEITRASMGNAYQDHENRNVDDPESDSYVGPETEVEREFTYATYTDRQRQRDPNGVYLDDVMRNEAEVQRAKVEGREPDLENPPSIAGDVMLPVTEAAKNLPGDFNVPVVRTLPVSVGVPSEDTEAEEE